MTRRGLRTIPALALIAMPAAPARAHAPIEGIGAFYNGLVHPFVVPAHLLTLLALGLLLGQAARRRAEDSASPAGPAASGAATPASGLSPVKFGLLAYGLALLAGLALGGLGLPSPEFPLILTLALTLGGLVAAAPRLPLGLIATLAAACGLIAGIDSRPEWAAAAEIAQGLAGTALGASLLPAAAAAWTLEFRQPWQQIGVRVAGSWIAAAALLVLAFAFAPDRSDGESRAPAPPTPPAATSPPPPLSGMAPGRRNNWLPRSGALFDNTPTDWHA